MDSQNQNIDLTLSEGTRWLIELELFNTPHLQNVILLNIYKCSNHIKHVNLLMDSNTKRLLIFLDLTWIGRTFYKESIRLSVLELIQATLPSHEIGITYSKDFFNKSLNLVKKFIKNTPTFIRD